MDELPKLLQTAAEALRGGHLIRAREISQKVLGLDPTNSAAHSLLGLAAESDGRFDDSLSHFHMAIKLDPGNVPLRYNYATLLHRTGRHFDALEQYERILASRPDYDAAKNNLCSLLNLLGETGRAERMAREIVTADPGSYVALTNLGNILKDSGMIDGAIDAYRKALAIEPGFGPASSNYLLCLNYCTTVDRVTVFDEHRRWESTVRGSSTHPGIPVRRSGEKIRIGYVSPDFRGHSVSFFIEPILECHDRSRFEVFCYSDVACPDAVTERFRHLDVQWRDIHGQTDERVRSSIRSDGLDILVDLAAHAGNTRLPLFLDRLAPVQIAYLGYPNTSGLSTMDYRLTDVWADPEGEERYYTEQLLRIADGFLCYKPPHCSPMVTEPPCLKNGFVTFGSFNNLPKINETVLDLWALVLKSVPESKLLIKTRPFNSPEVRGRYEALFASRGIGAARLMLRGFSPSMAAHLGAYGEIDIALDPTPYNGTTTTCEALWMGVPVVTLAGSCHAGRVGISILARVGLNGMIAQSSSQYVEIAKFLAGDPSRLARLRQGLRNAVSQSPLYDGPSFTRKLEKAYRTVWERARTLPNDQ